MAYWLCITNGENWKIIRERNIWGVSERHRNAISRVRPGDTLLIYVKQERINDETIGPRIVAIYRAVSEPFKSGERIFHGDVYPYRIKIEPVEIFERPIDFKSLIPKLSFIRNKKKWSGHLMGKAMREISEEDYQTLTSSPP